MNDEHEQMSQKVRAWLQTATNITKVDPYLTGELMNIVDRRASDIWAIGLAENTRVSLKIKNIKTNPFLRLASVFKLDMVLDRIEETNREGMWDTAGRLRKIFSEEAGSISEVYKQEFESWLDLCFPVNAETRRGTGL